MSILLEIYRKSLTHEPSSMESSSMVDEMKKLDELDFQIACEEGSIVFDLCFANNKKFNIESITEYEQLFIPIIEAKYGKS